MKAVTAPQRVIALSLAIILASCGTTRHAVVGPTGPQDLARYVLLVTQQPDGRVTHAWQPLAEFDLAAYQSQVHASRLHGKVVNVALTARDCQQEYEICVPQCRASTRTLQISKYVYDSKIYGPWRTGKFRYCADACMKQFANCMHDADPEPEAVRFEAIQPAVDWVKEHRNEILVGTVIVIAGVAFVAVVLGSGGGGLALLPLVVLVSSDGSPEFEAWAVKP